MTIAVITDSTKIISFIIIIEVESINLVVLAIVISYLTATEFNWALTIIIATTIPIAVFTMVTIVTVIIIIIIITTTMIITIIEVHEIAFIIIEARYFFDAKCEN